MPVLPQVTQWVEEKHKSPRIDPEWLNDCYEWLTTEGGHDPNVDLNALLDAVEYQILESAFSDSMLPGTGLPTHLALPTATAVLKGIHVLVEVISITEIANSAFNLNQTRVAREERIKAGDVNDDEGEGDIEVEGEGPMPKYPRGMLKFQLYDGTTTLPAIEYRSIPNLSLENTPLGFKMILKDVTIRSGIVWLDPESITLLGHKTEDRDEHRQFEFARGLRARMGLSEPELAPENRPPQVPILTNEPQRRNEHTLPRSPLREISPPPSPPLTSHLNDDEDLEPRRRRIPVRALDGPSVASAPQSDTQKSSASSHFTSTRTTSATVIDLVVSPPRRTTRPLFVQTPPSPPEENFWSSDEAAGINEENVEPHESSGKGKGKEPSLSSDSFGDDIMDLDPDFLASLDTVEREAYGRTQKAFPGSPTGSSRGNSSGPSGQFQRPAALRPQNGKPVIDVITIEDDEEEDDKENSPVPTRHVRRRTEARGSRVPTSQWEREPGRPVASASEPSDVIELSDSD